jgi:hypothetical protein
MIKFTDSERAFHLEMRGLTKDEHGRELLVGLTTEETEFYVTHVRRRAAGNRDRDLANQARFLELHQKHEFARLQTIGAEVELRPESPTRQ